MGWVHKCETTPCVSVLLWTLPTTNIQTIPKLKNAKGIWATYPAFGDCPASNLGAKMFKVWSTFRIWGHFPRMFTRFHHSLQNTKSNWFFSSFTQMFGNGVPILIWSHKFLFSEHQKAGYHHWQTPHISSQPRLPLSHSADLPPICHLVCHFGMIYGHHGRVLLWHSVAAFCEWTCRFM